MQQLKAFKYRIYPTEEQKSILSRYFGAKRWIYNHFLSMQKERRANGEKHLSAFDMNYMLTDIKRQDETVWLQEVDSIAIQTSAENLATAYQNFFDSINGKRKGKKMEPPKYKNKYSRQSYRTRGAKILENGKLKLPTIKSHINIHLHRPIEGKVKNQTISKNTNGEYYISFVCEVNISPLPMAGKEVGIDMGLKHVAITNDGNKFIHPDQLLAKTTQQLKRQQRKLSRMTKGSNNYKKQKIKVAYLYQKITNIRNNYYHVLSKYLVTNYDAIYVEDLNVAGMVKNHRLARAIQTASWGILSSMIEYKCNWYGKTYYRISRWAPSSKTCSCCGHKLESLSLKVREWTCPSCSTTHDRDINAAQNIKNMGQNDLYGRKLSDAIADMGDESLPMALQKMIDKNESSDVINNQLIMGESKPTSLGVGS